jgi:hypothetical protein
MELIPRRGCGETFSSQHPHSDSELQPNLCFRHGNALFHSVFVFSRQFSVREEWPNFTQCVAVALEPQQKKIPRTSI